jgi:nucleotide-binding universal stress UspA family protein
MSYKTILVHVDGSRHLYRRVEIAARLAKLHKAHVVGLALTELPTVFYDTPVINPLDPTLAPLLQVPRQRSDDALAEFERTARKFNIASLEMRHEENETVRGIILQARYCDLVLLGQHDPADVQASTRTAFAESVILESGVPVLVVPFASPATDTGHRVLVAWNASREAVRAVHYALPILQLAEQVEVVVFDPDILPATYRAVPDKDILEWLGRHGICATVTRRASPSDRDIASRLLSLATDRLADLLVMGCYGHSRFREVLLGGVSREILRTMTLPVLMAH